MSHLDMSYLTYAEDAQIDMTFEPNHIPDKLSTQHNLESSLCQNKSSMLAYMLTLIQDITLVFTHHRLHKNNLIVDVNIQVKNLGLYYYNCDFQGQI